MYCSTPIFLCWSKFSLAVFIQICQQRGEDQDAYMGRFHKRALDCYDLVTEEVQVNGCLHGMMEQNRIFLEYFPFPSFSRLTEGRQTHQWIHLEDLEVQFCSPAQSHCSIHEEEEVDGKRPLRNVRKPEPPDQWSQHMAGGRPDNILFYHHSCTEQRKPQLH